jgi:hypothetical protein
VYIHIYAAVAANDDDDDLCYEVLVCIREFSADQTKKFTNFRAMNDDVHIQITWRQLSCRVDLRRDTRVY